MKKAIKSLSLILIISCFLCGCVKQDDYDKLNEENQSLKKEVSNLEAENNRYRNQISDLEEQLEQATEEITEESISEEISDDISDYIPENVEYRTDITYDNLARTPDDYYMEYIEISGKVVQVIESDTETDLRIATASNGYDDVILAGYPPKTASERILEDDKVTVKGMYLGITQYESTMGGTISVPLVYVTEIERN